jgi:hypothetical protein
MAVVQHAKIVRDTIPSFFFLRFNFYLVPASAALWPFEKADPKSCTFSKPHALMGAFFCELPARCKRRWPAPDSYNFVLFVFYL